MRIELTNKCQCCLMEINAKDCFEISMSIRESFFEFTSVEVSSIFITRFSIVQFAIFPQLLTSEKLSSKICFECKDVISKSTMAKKSLISKQKELLKFLAQMEKEDPDGILVKTESDKGTSYSEGFEFFKSFIETNTEESESEVARSNSENEASTRLPARNKQSNRFQKPTRIRGARPYTVRNKHKCSECNFECVNKRSMDRHRYDHLEGQIEALTLPTAGEEVNKLNDKQSKHLRLNNKQGARPYIVRNTHKCSKCDFECVNKRSMDRHLYENCHKGAKPPPPPIIMCEICSKEFRDRALFNRHLDRHNNVKRFFCGESIYFLKTLQSTKFSF